MAKNLKLQIKNAQLAEALNIGKIKKPTGVVKRKKTAEEKPSAAIEAAAPVIHEPVAEAPPPPPPPPPEPVVEKETPRRPVFHEEEPEEPQPSFEPKTTERPSFRQEGGQRPPYRPSGDRPYRPAGDRPTGDRPYRPAGDRPYRPAGERPSGDRPYRPAGDRPYRPPGERPAGDRPYRAAGDRPYRSPGDRPYRPAGDRPAGQRPPYDRSSAPPRRNGPPGSPRPSSYPPGSTRPPYQKREFSPRGPRPPYSGDRTGAPRSPRPPGPPRGPMPASRGEGRPQRKTTAFKDYQDLRPQKKGLEAGPGFDSRDRMGLRSLDDEAWRKKRPQKLKRGEIETSARPKELLLRLPITIKDFATEMKLKASQIISKLFMQGVIVTINDYLDDDTTVQLLGHEFGCEIKIDRREAERIQITDRTIREEVAETDPEDLILRPPVVTFMGHVDHGKTSLIDAIRKTNMAAGEAGAITQHIGAFKCHSPVGDITILDTPGHEAFSAMRARGADVTDLVVLVVAGDEGMREQTIEAMNQAKTAKVPIMVALNKSDKPGFNPELVYRQLAEQELLPEVWGGATVTVNCSALTGEGIPELLEMLSLQSEVLELKANPDARARGTVIESEMHKGLGAVATILIQNGTLREGDSIVFDVHYARVKTMQDEYGKNLSEAGPSTPVKITGLSGLPEAGSEFVAVINEREAREIAQVRQEQHKERLQKEKRVGLEGLLEKKVETDKKKVLNLILRADVQGSLEALKHSLQKIHTNKVDLHFILEDVGQISESDIELATASNSTIIGFHTKVGSHAESLLKQKKVPIKLHDIIYHAVDDVRASMRDLLDKIPQENEMGEAQVKAVFKSSQLGLIAGCQVADGIIKRNHHARLVRGDKVIWKGHIASLKRGKEDVREVSKGLECGILLQNFSDFKEGDTIQSYEITYLEQEL